MENETIFEIAAVSYVFRENWEEHQTDSVEKPLYYPGFPQLLNEPDLRKKS